MQKNLKTLFLASLVALNGCAGQQAANQSAASAVATPTVPSSGADSKPEIPAKLVKLGVLYTTSFPDGSRLKETPEEIMIVNTEATQKNVATQAALGILTFALAGGIGFSGFGKEDLKGRKIDDVKDRNNVRNPVATDFVEQLRKDVNLAVDAKPDLYPSGFKNPINVAGGNTRLIYESLTGEEAQQYKMNTELEIYKRKEDAGLFTISPLVRVSCNRVSEKALPLEEWMKDDYAMAHQWMNETLRQCSEKVIGALPEMLGS
ncbi:hypothetical protein [Herbaspirillum chlorophenolicum]|uniref:hypothetical protein n=1 Tax=Herbaspirillum chlorophenolicum TaxID=211589 RepID=UPI00067E0440|nr:hypothetical protein [Herbaspirillum chlorophenolicum]